MHTIVLTTRLPHMLVSIFSDAAFATRFPIGCDLPWQSF